MAVFAGGHVLLEGVPGLGKTLLVRTWADVLDLRVQPHPVHPGPDAGRHHGHQPGHGDARTAAASSSSSAGRSSRS